jgi:UDP-N-acetylglucosamine 2-epimerase (non-hydrolysing)
MTSLPPRWKVPEGYDADHVSDIVVKFLLGGKWGVH